MGRIRVTPAAASSSVATVGPAEHVTTTVGRSVDEDRRDRPASGVDLQGPKSEILSVALPKLPSAAVTLLTKEQSEARYIALERGYGCDVRGQTQGREFSSDEVALVRRLLEKAGPILQCDNQPVRYIGRLSSLTGDTCERNRKMGRWYSSSGAVFFTDRARLELAVTILHEVAHGGIQSHDPRTCTAYETSDANPLVRAFREAVGWSADGTVLHDRVGNAPPTTYARKSADEDMADSLAYFLEYPDVLKRVSPVRYRFFETLFATLRATPRSPK